MRWKGAGISMLGRERVLRGMWDVLVGLNGLRCARRGRYWIGACTLALCDLGMLGLKH